MDAAGRLDTEGAPADIVGDRSLELPPGIARDVELEHSYDGPARHVRLTREVLEVDGASIALREGIWSMGEFHGEPVAVAGGWVGDTFTLMARMVHTPFAHILRLDPDGRLTVSVDRSFTGPGDIWSGLPK